MRNCSMGSSPSVFLNIVLGVQECSRLSVLCCTFLMYIKIRSCLDLNEELKFWLLTYQYMWACRITVCWVRK